MVAIQAEFDGARIMPKEPIPVKGPYEAIITFVRPALQDAAWEQPTKLSAKDEYPEGFFELFGALKDTALERPSQGAFAEDCPRESF
jgi:hypothetical protein